MPVSLHMRRWVSLGLCLLLTAALALAGTRPLKAIVSEYMEGDLETAIVPTPQKAELKDRAFVTGKVVVVKPERYDAPDTLTRELKALLGADNVVSVMTNRAIPSDQLVAAEILDQLEEIRAQPARLEEQLARREQMLQQVRARLRVAQRES